MNGQTKSWNREAGVLLVAPRSVLVVTSLLSIKRIAPTS